MRKRIEGEGTENKQQWSRGRVNAVGTCLSQLELRFKNDKTDWLLFLESMHRSCQNLWRVWWCVRQLKRLKLQCSPLSPTFSRTCAFKGELSKSFIMDRNQKLPQICRRRFWMTSSQTLKKKMQMRRVLLWQGATDIWQPLGGVECEKHHSPFYKSLQSQNYFATVILEKMVTWHYFNYRVLISVLKFRFCLCFNIIIPKYWLTSQYCG